MLPRYDLGELPLFASRSYEEIDNSIHNGNICCSRIISSAVEWEDVATPGEDRQFNQHVYRKFDTTAYLACPLVIYRNELSSFLAWK